MADGMNQTLAPGYTEPPASPFEPSYSTSHGMEYQSKLLLDAVIAIHLCGTKQQPGLSETRLAARHANNIAYLASRHISYMTSN